MQLKQTNTTLTFNNIEYSYIFTYTTNCIIIYLQLNKKIYWYYVKHDFTQWINEREFITLKGFPATFEASVNVSLTHICFFVTENHLLVIIYIIANFYTNVIPLMKWMQLQSSDFFSIAPENKSKVPGLHN